ncbi:MAG: hypothetical protein ACI9VN_002549 [Patescibacteria group bacterium]
MGTEERCAGYGFLKEGSSFHCFCFADFTLLYTSAMLPPSLL